MKGRLHFLNENIYLIVPFLFSRKSRLLVKKADLAAVRDRDYAQGMPSTGSGPGLVLLSSTDKHSLQQGHGVHLLSCKAFRDFIILLCPSQGT